MAWPKSKSLLVALLLGLRCLIAQAAPPIAAVSGTVTDAKGAPLEGVTVQVSGMEKFHVGAWHRELRLGILPSYSTDTGGRFELPFYETDIRYDLWFDKLGFAPTFLHGISAKSQELMVVMKRGTPVTGIVSRLVKAEREPVSGTMVELKLSTEDLWYQQRAFTDQEGRYTFRISPPPTDKKWSVVFAGEAVELDVKGEQPVIGPDFMVVVEVRNKTVRPSASVDTEGAPDQVVIMQQDEDAKRKLPVTSSGRFVRQPLTQTQIDEIRSSAEPLAPAGEEAWFILVRRNQLRGEKLQYAITVYYTPEEQTERIRRGHRTSFDPQVQKFIDVMTKSLGGTASSQPRAKRLSPYCQVSLADQPFGEDLKTPSGTLLPFPAPTGFTDDEIIAIVDFIRTSPARASAPSMRLSLSKFDGTAPIISIGRNQDYIEVKTGVLEGPLCGIGTFVRFIKTEDGFEVVAVGQWVS